MAAMHGSVHMVDTELDYEEVQHFETAAEEFINQLDWHEAATDKYNDEHSESISDNDQLIESENNFSDDKTFAKIDSIPSILEVVDVKNKVYQVSAVALKKAPIMMCYYKHHSVCLILDTGAGYCC